jgi:hypothetical protein
MPTLNVQGLGEDGGSASPGNEEAAHTSEAPAKVEPTTPAKVGLTTPAKVGLATSAKVEPTTLAKVGLTTPAKVEITTAYVKLIEGSIVTDTATFLNRLVRVHPPIGIGWTNEVPSSSSWTI